MCEHRDKVVDQLCEQALTAAKDGEHVWAIQKLIFAIRYQQDQIRDLEQQSQKRQIVGVM